MSKVALVSCTTYEQSMVDEALNEAINSLGGLDKFIKNGQTVVIKPNLVMKMSPDKVGTTHPAVVEAIAKKVINLGAKCIIADSPGGPYTKGYLNNVYKGTHMTDVAEHTGAQLNQDFGYQIVEFKNGLIGKKVEIINALLNADAIINVCKMKTHSFTGYSGAVKNMFGAIPGLVKVQMHGMYKTLQPFCDFNIDTIEFFKPKLNLHICDAIIGMEGPGPTSGTPIKIGKLIVSSNPYALDTVMVRMMNMNPKNMPTLECAAKRGLINKEFNVEVIGDDLENSVIHNYKTLIAQDHRPLDKYVPTFMQKAVGNFITRRPVVKTKNCKGCQKCKNHCPVNAISMIEKRGMKNKIIKFDYEKCIRCYCCQELCPYHIIKVKTPLGYKILRAKDLRKQRINNKKVAKDIVPKKVKKIK